MMRTCAFMLGLMSSVSAATPLSSKGDVRKIPQIAFISDVHLHDIHGSISGFDGLRSEAGHEAAVMRTMYAQLTSTRLFNENYFVFRAALDDALARGIRVIALPGDYTDDAQPLNVDGLKAILDEYEAKGLRFYLSPGNHDPNEPFDDEGGKDDFLGEGGRNQKIYSSGSPACSGQHGSQVSGATDSDALPLICAGEMRELGYAGILERLGSFGYMPRKDDIYWESPFSKPDKTGPYSFARASAEAAFEKRQFEICHDGEGGPYKTASSSSCATIMDASYLVEPIAGIWLLSIDANVYQPKPESQFDKEHPDSAGNFLGSGDAGYDKVRSHKKHLIAWIEDVVRRAKRENKELVAFSHFPMAEFYSGQSDRMSQLFKPKAFQMVRRPSSETTAALAATGLRLHVAGHMHINNTGVYPANGRGDKDGNFLVNIQSPSLGVFGAGYKILSFTNRDRIDVETVALDHVPRFNELFEHYEKEWKYLASSSDPELKKKLWNHDILASSSYYEFTRFYFGELSRLRFLNDYWPCLLKGAVSSFTAADMLTLSQLRSAATLEDVQGGKGLPLEIEPGCLAARGGRAAGSETLARDWQRAREEAKRIVEKAQLTWEALEALSAYQFYGDFHRTAYAGALGFRTADRQRLKIYELLASVFPPSAFVPLQVEGKVAGDNPLSLTLQRLYGELWPIFNGFRSGTPSGNFLIDFKKHTIIGKE